MYGIVHTCTSTYVVLGHKPSPFFPLFKLYWVSDRCTDVVSYTCPPPVPDAHSSILLFNLKRNFLVLSYNAGPPVGSYHIRYVPKLPRPEYGPWNITNPPHSRCQLKGKINRLAPRKIVLMRHLTQGYFLFLFPDPLCSWIFATCGSLLDPSATFFTSSPS